MMHLQGNQNFTKSPNFLIMQKTPIGIDVSKDTLDYLHLVREKAASKGVIQNNVSAIKEFLSFNESEKVFIVVEPTGTYSDKLMELAHQQDFEVRLANPRKSSQFTEVLGYLNKTDENAVFILADMGQKLNLPVFHPQSDILKERKQIQMTLNALSKQCRMLKNQLHALDQRLSSSNIAVNALEKSLETLETQRQLLEDELQELSDDEVEEFSKYAQSVKGIGPKNSNLLMIYTNGLKYFDKKAQLPKFIGTIGRTHRSGTSVNIKKSITKNGPSELRACLYNAAKSAKRYNHACKALYERLRKKGKPHKVAMIAVINKLLHQIFACVKNKILFDNELYLKMNN